MDVITDKMLEAMERQLKEALPPVLANFSYEVESQDSLLIYFMLDDIPDKPRLKLLREKACPCINGNLRVGDKVFSWVAIVCVGADRLYNHAIGGIQVDGFSDDTAENGPLSLFEESMIHWGMGTD